MDSVHISQKDSRYTVMFPPKPKWKCWLNPTYCLMVEDGKQPNWFHRYMQRLVLGIRWEEIDDDNAYGI